MCSKDGVEKVEKVSKEVKNFLGPDYKSITNKSQDSIFISKDGLRKIRFDIKNSHGDRPHIHMEEYKN